jgi:hypothetical protein
VSQRGTGITTCRYWREPMQHKHADIRGPQCCCLVAESSARSMRHGHAAHWRGGEREMTNKDALTAAKRPRFQKWVAGRLAETAGDGRQRRGHVGGTREVSGYARNSAGERREARAARDDEHAHDSAAGRRRRRRRGRGRGSRASPSHRQAAATGGGDRRGRFWQRASLHVSCSSACK